jgi:hypothetical protein
MVSFLVTFECELNPITLSAVQGHQELVPLEHGRFSIDTTRNAQHLASSSDVGQPYGHGAQQAPNRPYDDALPPGYTPDVSQPLLPVQGTTREHLLPSKLVYLNHTDAATDG